MDTTRSDLAAIRRALAAARVNLDERARDGAEGTPPDPEALAAAVGQVIGAVARMADLLEAITGDADGPRNSGVVDDTMPPGGPKFDRSRPHRGYGRGE